MIQRTPLLTNYNVETLYKNNEDLKKNYQPLQEPSADDPVASVKYQHNNDNRLYELVSKGAEYIREIGKDLLEQGKNIIDNPSSILQEPVHTLGILISLYFYKTAVAVFGLSTFFGYLEKTSTKDSFSKANSLSLQDDDGDGRGEKRQRHLKLFTEKKQRAGL